MTKTKSTETTNPAATAAPAAEKPGREAPVLTAISATVKMPENIGKRGRGANTIYPFAQLEIEQSFGIKNKTAKQIASVVSGAVKRYMVEKLDANGNKVFKTNKVKQADGTVTEVPTLEAEMVKTREFVAFDVDVATDPDSASVRVFRKA